MKKLYLIGTGLLLLTFFLAISLISPNDGNNVTILETKNISSNFNAIQNDSYGKNVLFMPGFEGPITVTALFVLVSIISILRKHE